MWHIIHGKFLCLTVTILFGMDFSAVETMASVMSSVISNFLNILIYIVIRLDQVF